MFHNKSQLSDGVVSKKQKPSWAACVDGKCSGLGGGTWASLRDPTWRVVLCSGPLRGRSRARGSCGEGTQKLDSFVSAERTGEPSRERKDSLGARRAALTHREGCP